MSGKKECWSTDEENFRYGSLSELLETHDEMEIGQIVFVGEAVEPNIGSLCDSEDVIDTIAERAYDIAGDYAEDCADVSKEARMELDALLQGWIKRHCNLNFYGVVNVRGHALTAADLDVAPTQANEPASTAQEKKQ